MIGVLRLAGLAVGVAVLLLLGYGVLETMGKVGNASRSEAVARHEAFLRQIPVYPGALHFGDETRGSKDKNGYPEGLGPVTRYSTVRVFNWARAAPAEPQVVEWYRSRMPSQCEFGWGEGTRGSGGRSTTWRSAGFDCGSHSVLVDPSDEWLTVRVMDRT